jgi:hypothetical protein
LTVNGLLPGAGKLSGVEVDDLEAQTVLAAADGAADHGQPVRPLAVVPAAQLIGSRTADLIDSPGGLASSIDRIVGVRQAQSVGGFAALVGFDRE